MYNTLYESYYRGDPIDRYLVQMQSQTKVTGVNLPEVHGSRKIILAQTPIDKSLRYKRDR